jgi:hypothetical protein
MTSRYAFFTCPAGHRVVRPRNHTLTLSTNLPCPMCAADERAGRPWGSGGALVETDHRGNPRSIDAGD